MIESHLDRWFRLRERGTTAATEARAGLVTLAYILFVNPQILAQAGMPADDVAVATALAAAAATLLMGFLAGYPVALAPGMGLNAYSTFGVVQGLGVSWQVALAAVFVEGLLFLALAVLGVRTALLTYSIANGISLGIVSWVAIKLLAGRWREVHPVLGALAAFYGWR